MSLYLTSTVPVGLWVVQAFTDSNTLESESLHVIEKADSDLMNRGVVNIVHDRQIVLVGRADATTEERVNNVERGLNGIGSGVEVVLSIEIKVGNVITESSHGLHTSSITGGVWWTHISWELADNISHSHLELGHFSAATGLGNGGEIGVRPGVRSNLVLLGNHTAEDGGVWGAFVINLTLAVVDAGNKESGLCAVRSEDIEKIIGVDVGSVVVGESDFAIAQADVDVGGVGDIADVGTRDRGSVGARGCCVSVTAAKVEETVRGLAVFLSGSLKVLLAINSCGLKLYRALSYRR
jgi:hypothetical protein